MRRDLRVNEHKTPTVLDLISTHKRLLRTRTPQNSRQSNKTYAKGPLLAKPGRQHRRRRRNAEGFHRRREKLGDNALGESRPDRQVSDVQAARLASQLGIAALQVQRHIGDWATCVQRNTQHTGVSFPVLRKQTYTPPPHTHTEEVVQSHEDGLRLSILRRWLIYRVREG